MYELLNNVIFNGSKTVEPINKKLKLVEVNFVVTSH